MVSAITTTHAGGSEVHNLNRARQLSFLQNVQASYSTHVASNSMKTKPFSLAVKWTGQTGSPLICV